MKTLCALMLGLLLSLGCGLRGSECGRSPYPDDYCEPFEPFGALKEAASLKCSFFPFYCCDTCGDNEGCLSWCIEREEQ